MRVIRSGHCYKVENFENKSESQEIQFIEKEQIEPGSTELVTVYDGTTTEELLKVLINRMQYLQGKLPCRENAIVITKLEESLMWLDKKNADR